MKRLNLLKLIKAFAFVVLAVFAGMMLITHSFAIVAMFLGEAHDLWWLWAGSFVLFVGTIYVESKLWEGLYDAQINH